VRTFHVVLRRCGPQWRRGKPVEEQSGWREHAAFMDALVDAGFIVLGGPLADEERVVHAVEAASEDEVRATLARDPWSESHLRIDSIDPWTIRLDARRTESVAPRPAERPSARSGPALIVVDVQRGFDEPSWGPRDNPDCERRIASLLERWRDRRWPVVFVRHDSVEHDSPLAAGTAGNAFKDVLAGSPDLLVTKSVNSAFHGEPSLQGWLQARGVDRIYVCGITTNHCCETTARVGGNLGYDVRFVLDATHTFDLADPAGSIVPAAQLARVTATNLHGEFATVIDTAAALAET